MRRLTTRLLVVIAPCLAGAAHAAIVQVDISGAVSFNGVPSGPLAGVPIGAPASMRFRLDSNVFTNSAIGPRRGYVIDQSSLEMSFGSLQVGLTPSFSLGYFVLRDNDPGVDGFYVSTTVDNPGGLPTDIPGSFGAFRNNFGVGYDGSTLGSLDILGAVGTYGFSGLTNFNWVMEDGPFEPFGADFTSMTISIVPAPACAPALLAALGAARRRTR